MLRDIAHAQGAVTLSPVLRFTDPDTGRPNHAEGAASLALRDGDPAALGYYIDHRRVHVGELDTATDHAYAAWSADRAAGRDAIMLAPTRDLVAELNDRARRDRLTAEGGPPGRQVRLADGSHASTGDVIITRRNDRRIALGPTDWVKNGDRFTVHAVHASGALDVVAARTGRRRTLPAGYVTAHVALGYACTVHAAQGVTADAGHTVATGQETRQLLYVALTRGRHANHLYLATAGDGDPHTVITRDALLPRDRGRRPPAHWAGTARRSRPAARPAPSPTLPGGCTRTPTATTMPSPPPRNTDSGRPGLPRSTPPPRRPCPA